jgi:hypothetical protein
MGKITFLVQGSSADPYEVDFQYDNDGELMVFCTCQAGQTGTHCKREPNGFLTSRAEWRMPPAIAGTTILSNRSPSVARYLPSARRRPVASLRAGSAAYGAILGVAPLRVLRRFAPLA